MFFCGVTAARLLALPLPFRFTAAGSPLDVAVPSPARALRRTHVRGRELRVNDGDVIRYSGLALTGPARTWCDLAHDLTLGELVGVGDHLTALLPGAITVDELRVAVARHPGRRGMPVRRRALELIDPLAESVKESELRVILIENGFPRPEVNPTIFDERGRLVARVDLLLRDYGEVLEYQGDHHRTDLRQWRRDRTREAELESLGLHVTEVTAADLRDVDGLLRRLERTLRRRGWPPRAQTTDLRT